MNPSDPTLNPTITWNWLAENLSKPQLNETVKKNEDLVIHSLITSLPNTTTEKSTVINAAVLLIKKLDDVEHVKSLTEKLVKNGYETQGFWNRHINSSPANTRALFQKNLDDVLQGVPQDDVQKLRTFAHDLNADAINLSLSVLKEVPPQERAVFTDRVRELCQTSLSDKLLYELMRGLKSIPNENRTVLCEKMSQLSRPITSNFLLGAIVGALALVEAKDYLPFLTVLTQLPSPKEYEHLVKPNLLAYAQAYQEKDAAEQDRLLFDSLHMLESRECPENWRHSDVFVSLAKLSAVDRKQIVNILEQFKGPLMASRFLAQWILILAQLDSDKRQAFVKETLPQIKNNISVPDFTKLINTLANSKK